METPRQGPFEADVATLLEIVAASGRPPFEALGVEGARAAYRNGRDTVQLEPVALSEVRDLRLTQTLRARMYRPVVADTAAPGLLYFHGGGWVIGDLDTHDAICRRLALASGRVVVAVEYRLAPEHRFPAAFEDALAAHDAMVAQATAFDIDPADLAVAGDSAGAALAAAVALTASERGTPTPVAAILFYPVTDLRGLTQSYRSVRDVPITGATLHWFRDQYLAEPDEAADWRTSPLLAPSLDDLPPTFVTSAGHDPLCDEAFLFAARLRDSGVSVVHRHLPGQIHGYLTLGRLLGEAERSIAAAGIFLKGLSHR